MGSHSASDPGNRGNIDAFAEKVKATHGENEHAKRYMAAIELAKVCIDLTAEE